jgi:RNA polymerase sigma factor (sigma-70 family)
LIAAKRKSKEARGMKVQYRFCNETVEIEVDEKWGAVVLDCDRVEYNNDQTQTRRHCSLEAYNLDDALLPSDVDVEATILLKEAIQHARSPLNDRQKRLIQAVFFEGLSYVEIARREGRDPSSIREATERALMKLKKYFQ